MQEMKFEIRGMSCQHCVRGVREALEEVAGVENVEVAVGSALVRCDESVERNALTEAIIEAGYEVV